VDQYALGNEPLGEGKAPDLASTGVSR
jgi:hypothetical protein